MKNLTYILPVHIYNKDVERYLKRLFSSLENVDSKNKEKLLIIGPAGVLDKVKEIVEKTTLKNTSFIENEDTNIFTQINNGVLKCTTKFFSILELDDEVMPFWPSVAEPYVEAKKDVSLFLPIVHLKDEKNGNSALSNEVAWASSFSDELGYIDLGALENYMDYIISGGICKTEDFISSGMLKPSLSIASTYEFLLRFAYSGKKIYVVPKCGYIHYVNRDGSFYKTETERITNDEAMEYIKLAKKEYFFENDRGSKESKKD